MYDMVDESGFVFKVSCGNLSMDCSSFIKSELGRILLENNSDDDEISSHIINFLSHSNSWIQFSNIRNTDENATNCDDFYNIFKQDGDSLEDITKQNIVLVRIEKVLLNELVMFNDVPVWFVSIEAVNKVLSNTFKRRPAWPPFYDLNKS